MKSVEVEVKVKLDVYSFGVITDGLFYPVDHSDFTLLEAELAIQATMFTLLMLVPYPIER